MVGSKHKTTDCCFCAAKPPKARSGQSRRLAKAIVRDYATVEGLSFTTEMPLARSSLRYPERAQELTASAEATAKAKYERLKKLVEFYNI